MAKFGVCKCYLVIRTNPSGFQADNDTCTSDRKGRKYHTKHVKKYLRLTMMIINGRAGPRGRSQLVSTEVPRNSNVWVTQMGLGVPKSTFSTAFEVSKTKLSSFYPNQVHERRFNARKVYLRKFEAPCVAAAQQAQASQPPPGVSPPKKKIYPVEKECVPVTSDVSLLRALCTERLPEIQFGQKKGTTTNSYVVAVKSPLTPDKDRILVDLPSASYDYDIAEWLTELDLIKRIGTVVITRLNPERLPALRSLLEAASERNEKLTVYMSNLAKQLLEERCEADDELKSLVEKHAVVVNVTRGTTISLGGGELLKFVPIPTPRWPDLVAVYSTSDRILFSSSFFAAHEASDPGSNAFDDAGWERYGESWRYYFDCMLAPAARQVLVSLDRLRINGVDPKKDVGGYEAFLGPLRSVLNAVTEATMGADDGVPEPLAVSYICPIHGPVIKSSITELCRKYKDWTLEQVKMVDSSNVAVLYASAYGNTAALAQAISRGITKAGVGVETLNLEIVGVDEVAAAVERSSGFVIGSPTLGGHMPTQVQTALGTVMRVGATKKIPCGVFGSFGWSGEAVDMMEGKLKVRLV